MEETNKKFKNQAILLIIGLLIGLVLGYFFFSESKIFTTNEDNYNEVTILNKEINNCIDKLNICENKLEKIDSNQALN